jgi:hypothetical protein
MQKLSLWERNTIKGLQLLKERYASKIWKLSHAFFIYIYLFFLFAILGKDNDWLLVVEIEYLLIEAYVMTKMSCFYA